jgi:hypothetical protein
MAAGPAQPGYADPRSNLMLRAVATLEHGADDLVTRYDGQLRIGELAIDQVQIGAAHSAGTDLDQDLPGAGHRSG